MIIAENLRSIFQYFEKRDLVHQKIGLYSNLSPENFESTLVLLQQAFPKLELNYVPLQEVKPQLCNELNHDMSIIIPSEILKSQLGEYKYEFQSHLKNRFGTFTVCLIQKGNDITSTHNQFFVTHIGD